MKKVMMMIALMAVPFALMAQTKFHDVELNDATGPVKSIVSDVMGRSQTVTFTQDGKMTREGMSNAKYDDNGYLKSATMSMMASRMMTMMRFFLVMSVLKLLAWFIVD